MLKNIIMCLKQCKIIRFEAKFYNVSLDKYICEKWNVLIRIQAVNCKFTFLFPFTEYNT